MDFKDIASVAGKPGLFQIIKPTRNGVIVESIDSAKNKLVISTSTKMSILKDISIFVTTEQSSVPLTEVFKSIKNLYPSALEVTSKSTDEELRSFFAKVVPSYDTEKVYLSDIKKVVAWFRILSESFPSLLEEKAEEAADESATAPAAEVKVPSPKKTSKASMAKSANTSAKPITKSPVAAKAAPRQRKSS